MHFTGDLLLEGGNNRAHVRVLEEPELTMNKPYELSVSRNIILSFLAKLKMLSGF